MNAQAVVFEEAQRVRLRDVTLREPEPDEVVVATKFSSISSGTERLLFDGKLPGIPHLRYPLVPGYEAAGIVCATGARVEGVHNGDAVFVGGSMAYTDVAAAFGGQSSHVIKRASAIVPLNGMALQQAPLLALAATALHGVRRLGDVAGKRVAVIGLGAVGQLAARFLSAAGARTVIADRSAERLALAPGIERIDLGAAELDAGSCEPVAAVIEATGNSALLARCARILEPGGNILLLSYYDTLTTPFADLFVKEATLLTSREWAPADLSGARDAVVNGDVDLGALAGHVVPIEHFAAAYDTAFNDQSILKVVLQWA